MADPNFSWIYLIIFLAIPLSRIIPRLIAKRKIQKNTSQQKVSEDGFVSFKRPQTETNASVENQKHLSKNKIVLREINQGVKTFENIQKNTGLNDEELNSILEDLEREGFMKVVHKQGLFGPKVELHSTDKRFIE